MDQLRTLAAWLKKQHFWVLTALVALIGLGSWWKAAGTLSEQFKKNKSQIEAEFSSLSALQSNAFHPNDAINQMQAVENKKMAESVNAVWQRLYERQRESVLEWPAALKQEFRDYVEKLEFGAEIPPHLRQNYQDYVERHFPKLPAKISARPLAEDERGPFGGGEMMPRGMFRGEGGIGPGMPAAGAEADDGDYIVEWLDQGHVRQELEFPQRPSSLLIWWTQENLWVYHTLLDVIRNTNEAAGATRMSNAAVRSIYSLEVGRPAGQVSRAKDRIVKVQVAAPTPGEEMLGGEMGAMMEQGEAAPGPEMGFQPGMIGDSRTPMTPEQEAAYLLSHRYLGDDLKPIPAGGMGGGGGGEFADPAAPAAPVDLSAFGKEYKRLPVRMVLEMDQRWLPELISQCASQPLQVEVQEVRINPPDGGGLEGGGFGGAFRGFEGGGVMGNLFPDRAGLLTFPQQPHMVRVVLQGIIYIFKQPDPTLLQTSEEPPLAAAP